MTTYHRIAVLMGGRSAEREVSLSSGRGVMKALKDEGFDPVEVDPGEDLFAQLRAAKPDAVFNALHGRFGEDGTVQGISIASPVCRWRNQCWPTAMRRQKNTCWSRPMWSSR